MVMALILRFNPFFSFFPYMHVNIKHLCPSFLGRVKTRIVKLGIQMDNELTYCEIENKTHCFYSSSYLSIFLSFKAKFVPQISQNCSR